MNSRLALYLAVPFAIAAIAAVPALARKKADVIPDPVLRNPASPHLALTSRPRVIALSLPATHALDALVSQLQRRFHQRNNVDFGFERVDDDRERSHRAPVMNLAMDPGDLKYLPGDEKHPDGLAKLPDGIIIPWDEVKERMLAENKTELRAIRTLRETTDGFAIYTAGLFDDRANPTRLKGPAYLSLKAPDAPKVELLKSAARDAWKADASVQAGPDGWMVRAISVRANDESCTSCHNERNADDTADGNVRRQKDPYRVGDRLGLILIAYRPRQMLSAKMQ